MMTETQISATDCHVTIKSFRNGERGGLAIVADGCRGKDERFFMRLEDFLSSRSQSEISRIRSISLMGPATVESTRDMRESWGRSCGKKDESGGFLAAYGSGGFSAKIQSLLESHGIRLHPTEVENFYVVPSGTVGALRHEACKSSDLLMPLIWFTSF